MTLYLSIHFILHRRALPILRWFWVRCGVLLLPLEGNVAFLSGQAHAEFLNLSMSKMYFSLVGSWFFQVCEDNLPRASRPWISFWETWCSYWSLYPLFYWYSNSLGRIQELALSCFGGCFWLKSQKYLFLLDMHRVPLGTHPVQHKISECFWVTDGLLCDQNHMLFWGGCAGNALVHRGDCGLSAEAVSLRLTGWTFLSSSFSLPVFLSLCLSSTQIVWPAKL